jgi:hypothetical protein
VTEISPDGIRRYLLGEATEAEAPAIEAEYFRSEPVLERIAAIEDELVEAFLADELSPSDRDRFERVYLASAVHRRRVDVIRRLGAIAPGASALSSRRRHPATSWRGGLAVAAAALLAVGAAVWWVRTETGRAATPPAAIVRAPDTPADRPLPPPRTIAMTLSPLAVRSAGDAPRLIIPPGTEVVVFDLQTDAAVDVASPTRAVVRTAGGDEVWRGPAAAPPANVESAILARIEVPAERLPADDYVITLLAPTAAGGAAERARFVLRVRGQ